MPRGVPQLPLTVVFLLAAAGLESKIYFVQNITEIGTKGDFFMNIYTNFNTLLMLKFLRRKESFFPLHE